ncbi:MAG: DNA replication and repair protein RecF [Magnetococcus sp. YQC-3]
MSSVAMRLERLRIQNFRNIAQASLEWGGGLNLLLGANGQGKTNLLEAIGLLASGRSFRRAPAAVLRRHGEGGFYLHGEVVSGGLPHRLEFAGLGRELSVKLNGKGVAAASAMGQVLAAVVLTPDAPALIRGAPEERRAYLDWIIFCHERAYAGVVRDYQVALRARNHLLRTQCQDDRQYAAWESRLAVLGAEIALKRRHMLRRVAARFAPFLDAMALDPEGYGWQIREEGELAAEGEDRVVAYQAMWERSRPADRRSGSTSSGPHREDPQFLQNGRSLARFASRGQQKRFLLALKLAESDLLQERLGMPPLLLLDDPMTELDQEGSGRLLRILAEGANQVFLATCAAEGISWPPSRPFCRVEVAAGVFRLG